MIGPEVGWTNVVVDTGNCWYVLTGTVFTVGTGMVVGWVRMIVDGVIPWELVGLAEDVLRIVAPSPWELEALEDRRVTTTGVAWWTKVTGVEVTACWLTRIGCVWVTVVVVVVIPVWLPLKFLEPYILSLGGRGGLLGVPKFFLSLETLLLIEPSIWKAVVMVSTTISFVCGVTVC